jgi:Fe-S-cluster containining protein
VTKQEYHTDRQKKARMNEDSLFQFNCSRGVSCFTQCCQDVTILLTPFDVLRLKQGLGVSSNEFLDRYTVIVPKANRLIPMVVLKMNEQDDNKCSFVTEQGCMVYAHRPWPCRMFPLNMNDDGTFSLITDSSRCLGLEEIQKMPLVEWLVEQGIPIYDEMNTRFSEITIPLKAEEAEIENPQIHKMTFMALYNLDRFRDFIFQSTFLDRFNVDPVVIEKIKRNDVELLKFAFDWIKFGVFGQKTFSVRPDAAPENKGTGQS